MQKIAKLALPQYTGILHIAAGGRRGVAGFSPARSLTRQQNTDTIMAATSQYSPKSTSNKCVRNTAPPSPGITSPTGTTLAPEPYARFPCRASSRNNEVLQLIHGSIRYYRLVGSALNFRLTRVVSKNRGSSINLKGVVPDWKNMATFFHKQCHTCPQGVYSSRSMAIRSDPEGRRQVELQKVEV